MNTHVPNIPANEVPTVQVPVPVPTITVAPTKKLSRKRFLAEEVVAICKAYCFATNDLIKGSNQRLEIFNSTLLQHLKNNAPNDRGEGTYEERGENTYRYLCDSVFPVMQKFNKSQCIVEYSNPSSVDEEQKTNMAIAIYMKETKLMEYKYKDFDSMKWRFFQAWKVLHNIPKFAMDFTPAALASTKRGTEDSETVPNTTSTEESDTSTLLGTEIGFNHDASRGGGKGKKVTMKKIEIEKEKNRKRKRDEQEINISYHS